MKMDPEKPPVPTWFPKLLVNAVRIAEELLATPRTPEVVGLLPSFVLPPRNC